MAASGGYPAATRPQAADAPRFPADESVGQITVSGAQVPATAPSPDQILLQYLEEAYISDLELSSDVVRSLLLRAGPQGVDWTLTNDDGLAMLHLAAINEATPPAELTVIIHELVRHGAPVNYQDKDGDTALDAVMTITEEMAMGAYGDDKEARATAQAAQLASVRTLMSLPECILESKKVSRLAAWLRRNFPDDCHQQFLAELKTKVGEEQVEKAWCSEMLMQYLEDCAYDNNKGVEATRVRDFLERGADPGYRANGATPLLLVVLNSYSTVPELTEVFDLLVKLAPETATERDGFNLTPLNWAVDYQNVSSQSGLQIPNPATLLALLPSLISWLPADLDAGEACFKTSPKGFCTSVPSPGATASKPGPPRFLEGDRVLSRIEVPGRVCAWEEGVVIGLWYREACWPADHPGAPYEVRLDIGARVFALVDDDRIIRTERGPKIQRAPQPLSATKARTGAVPPKGGKRFQKRQREDGEWELVDTVTGKAKPSSPPDSDEED